MIYPRTRGGVGLSELLAAEADVSEEKIDPLAVIDFELDGWEHGSDPHTRLSRVRAAFQSLLNAAREVDALSIQSEAHTRLRLALRGIAANT